MKVTVLHKPLNVGARDLVKQRHYICSGNKSLPQVNQSSLYTVLSTSDGLVRLRDENNKVILVNKNVNVWECAFREVEIVEKADDEIKVRYR